MPLRPEQQDSIYWREKLRRTNYYYRFIYGWVQVPCGACSGSGYYDHNGSPPCGCCNGTGKERQPGPKWHALPDHQKRISSP